MTGPEEPLCLLSAREMVTRLRRREISAVELMEAHLRQIERRNPTINAIVTLDAERALAGARAADRAIARGEDLGPLHGLPIAHKDLQETAGMRTTFGSPIYRDYVPQADSLLVDRLRRAGAIAIGKTNTPEFGAGSQTFNPLFGSTRNPYDLTKTVGGSSGGAAAALATGMVPIADGSDMGGSLRNPASFCNVVGMRPSPGRVPSGPEGLGWFTLSVDGPMARNVGDVAVLLSAMAGPDPRSPIALEEPGSIFCRPLQRDWRGVRVAWTKGLGLPFESVVRATVDRQRATFESLGVIVEEAEPDFAGADLAFKAWRAWSFEVSLAEEWRDHRDQLKDTIRWNIEEGLRLTGPELARAEIARTQLWHRVREFMTRYDFFVLPTVQVLPFDIDCPYPRSIAGVEMATYIDWMKSCYYISVLGNPAISIPAGFSPEGLPVGLQIVGCHRDDWGVLQLAWAAEAAGAAGAAGRRGSGGSGGGDSF
jgi:amidase